MSSPRPPLPHDVEWGQRLEEWRDGLASASEAVAVESHIAGCPICQGYLAELAQLDAALSSNLSVPSLSTDFDLKIWARVDANREIERALAKQRAQEELQQQLGLLRASWRRRLGSMIPGVLTGIALAFWLVSLISHSPAMASFAAALQQQLGATTAQLVQPIVTGLFGAAIGFAMSQWVVPSSE
jgi:anti-sigma factor RsiW